MLPIHKIPFMFSSFLTIEYHFILVNVALQLMSLLTNDVHLIKILNETHVFDVVSQLLPLPLADEGMGRCSGYSWPMAEAAAKAISTASLSML